MSAVQETRRNWMVALDVVGLIACLAVLTFFRKEIPGEVVGLLSTIAGIFGLCLRDAHQWEFGSSKGSKEANERNERLIEKLGTAAMSAPKPEAPGGP
jgi:hypothetical protein